MSGLALLPRMHRRPESGQHCLGFDHTESSRTCPTLRFCEGSTRNTLRASAKRGRLTPHGIPAAFAGPLSMADRLLSRPVLSIRTDGESCAMGDDASTLAAVASRGDRLIGTLLSEQRDLS